MDGNLSDAHLNVPALLAIKVWMAMLETGLSVPNTVDQQPMDCKLSDPHLNVPTLLVIDSPMAKSEAYPLNTDVQQKLTLSSNCWCSRIFSFINEDYNVKALPLY